MGIEGGEALTFVSTSEEAWYALWTQSHCEQLVQDQLRAKGFTTFLPMMRTWSRRRGVQRLIPVPMFAGYLFVRHGMDKAAFVEISKTRGLVRILCERWDRLTPIAADEIEGLRTLVASDLELMPHAFLREGHRVRVISGLLAGVEGFLLRRKPKHGLLVLSVELLHRSVAVEVECTCVTPVSSLAVAV